MKSLAASLLIISLFTRCVKENTPVSGYGSFTRETVITLHQTLELGGSTDNNPTPDKVRVTFAELNDSRCPLNAMCIRNGSAVTHFWLERNNERSQPVELVLGEALPTDTRPLRHRTADTMLVTVAKARYQVILKAVLPYPCTSCPDQGTPQATIQVKAR